MWNYLRKNINSCFIYCFNLYENDLYKLYKKKDFFFNFYMDLVGVRIYILGEY